MLGMNTKSAVEALKDVDFRIEENEVFGLIGRNGAGKTTLTKIIATLVRPTSGSVKVREFDSVDDEVKVRSLVGLATAEERSFYWRLTCSQNMQFFARLHGLSESQSKKRISELFEILGLDEYAKRRFSDLSTGNKQKLAVARALLANPKVLLLDEPTRSLDPIAASAMRDQISALEGVTILLTSHNLSEIEELCSRVAVISKGSIRALGTPEELRAENRQAQNVKIRIDQSLPESIKIDSSLEGFSYEESPHGGTLSFERDVEDDSLGETITVLNKQGIRVLDVETRQSTLLEVLEKFD